MAKFHFFTEEALLNTQTTDEFGKLANVLGKNRFRVTSVHKASADPKAFAVCSGLICVQEVNASFVNIILKPAEQPPFHFPQIRYYIYKGVKKSSLIAAGKVKVATALDLNTNVIRDYRNKSGLSDEPSQDVLGLGLNASSSPLNIFADSDPIDHLFHRGEIQLPIVKATDVIGEFDKNKIGFEVILERNESPVLLAAARELETIIKVTKLPASASINPDDPTLFDHKYLKEQLLNYVDPCAFFGRFYYDKLFIDSQNTAITGADIYTNILDKFVNKNKLYIDIRAERDENYNRYGLFDTNVHFSLDDTNYTAVNFRTDDWPLLILDGATLLPSAAQEGFSLKLPIQHRFVAFHSIFDLSFNREISRGSIVLKSGEALSMPMFFSLPKSGSNLVGSYILIQLGEIAALEDIDPVIPLPAYSNGIKPEGTEDFDQIFDLGALDKILLSSGIHPDITIPFQNPPASTDMHIKMMRQEKFVAAKSKKLEKSEFYYTGITAEGDNVSMFAFPTDYVDANWGDVSTERPFLDEGKANVPNFTDYLKKYKRLVFVKKEQTANSSLLQSLHFLQLDKVNELKDGAFIKGGRKKLDFYSLSISYQEYLDLIELKTNAIASAGFIEDYGFNLIFSKVESADKKAKVQGYLVGLSGIRLDSTASTPKLVRDKIFPLIPAKNVILYQNKQTTTYYNNQTFLISQAAITSLNGTALSSTDNNIRNIYLKSDLFRDDTVCNGIGNGEYAINTVNQDIFNYTGAIKNLKIALKIVLPDLIDSMLAEPLLYNNDITFENLVKADKLAIFLLPMDDPKMNDFEFNAEFRNYFKRFKEVYNIVYHNQNPGFEERRPAIPTPTVWDIDQETISALDLELTQIVDYDIERGKVIWSGHKVIHVGEYAVPNHTTDNYFDRDAFLPYQTSEVKRKNCVTVLKNMGMVEEGRGPEERFARAFILDSEHYFFQHFNMLDFMSKPASSFPNADTYIFYECILHYFSAAPIGKDFFYNFTYYLSRFNTYIAVHDPSLNLLTGEGITHAESELIFDTLKAGGYLTEWDHPIKQAAAFTLFPTNPGSGYSGNFARHSQIISYFFTHLRDVGAMYSEPSPTSQKLGFMYFNQNIFLESCSFGADKWFKVRNQDHSFSYTVYSLDRMHYVGRYNRTWGYDVLDPVTGKAKFEMGTCKAKDGSEVYVFFNRYLPKAYVKSEDVFLRHPSPEPNAILYKIKSGEGTLSVAHKFYGMIPSNSTNTNANQDLRYYANALLFANNMRGAEARMNYAFDFDLGKFFINPDPPTPQKAAIYVDPTKGNALIDAYTTIDTWIDEVTGASGTTGLDKQEAAQQSRAAGSVTTDWAYTMLDEGQYLWIPNKHFVNTLKDVVAGGSISASMLQNLKELFDYFWPVGQGISVDFSIGATFGIPLGLDGQYIMILYREKDRVWKLTRRGTLSGGLDSSVGFSAGFGFGRKLKLPMSSAKSKKQIGAGISAEINGTARVGLTTHQEYTFDLDQDGALAGLFYTAVLGNIPIIGGISDVILKSFTSWNIDPNQYMTRSIIKPFFYAGISAGLHAKIGIVKDDQNTGGTWNNYHENDANHKVKQPFLMKVVLKLMMIPEINLTAGASLEIAAEIENEIDKKMNHFSILVAPSLAFPIPILPPFFFWNISLQTTFGIKFSVHSDALRDLDAALKANPSADQMALAAAAFAHPESQISVVFGDGEFQYYDGLPAYETSIIFNGLLVSQYLLGQSFSTDPMTYFKGISYEQRLALLALDSSILGSLPKMKGTKYFNKHQVYRDLNLERMLGDHKEWLLHSETCLRYKIEGTFRNNTSQDLWNILRCIRDIANRLVTIVHANGTPKFPGLHAIPETAGVLGITFTQVVDTFAILADHFMEIWEDAEQDQAIIALVDEFLTYMKFDNEGKVMVYTGFGLSAGFKAAVVAKVRLQIGVEVGVFRTYSIPVFLQKLKECIISADNMAGNSPNVRKILEILLRYTNKFLDISNL